MSYKKLYSTPEYTPIEISTDAEMAAVLLDDNNLGKVYKFTGTSGTYINGDLYEAEYFDPLTIPLTFTANTAGSTVSLELTGDMPWSGSYSLDNATWVAYTPGTTGAITLTNAGDKVYFKGTYNDSISIYNYIYFSMSGSISSFGNIMSLCTETGFESLATLQYDYQFVNLFLDCDVLTTSPILPATTLTTYCYLSMFENCASLTSAPELPATTLAEGCYSGMFYNCTSLTIAPALPATTLAEDCYSSMFMSCSSLIEPPELPATTLKDYCYSAMFMYCTALATAPELPALSATMYCYNGMFGGCEALEIAPSLPATTLAYGCYGEMFGDCTALTTVPKLPATTLFATCYGSSFMGMFMGCSSLQVSDAQTAEAQYAWRFPTSGTFTNTYAQSNMFAGCAGNRASNTMPGQAGQSYTYYTQNEPV